MGFFGLMTVAEHDRLCDIATADLRTKLAEEAALGTTTALDLAEARRENGKMAGEITGLKADVAAAERAADANKIDAQKWRDRAAREHARRTKTRSPTPKPVAAKVKRGAK